MAGVFGTIRIVSLEAQSLALPNAHFDRTRYMRHAGVAAPHNQNTSTPSCTAHLNLSLKFPLPGGIITVNVEVEVNGGGDDAKELARQWSVSVTLSCQGR